MLNFGPQKEAHTESNMKLVAIDFLIPGCRYDIEAH
jgi:hypothetical protein